MQQPGAQTSDRDEDGLVKAGPADSSAPRVRRAARLAIVEDAAQEAVQLYQSGLPFLLQTIDDILKEEAAEALKEVLRGASDRP